MPPALLRPDGMCRPSRGLRRSAGLMVMPDSGEDFSRAFGRAASEHQQVTPQESRPEAPSPARGKQRTPKSGIRRRSAGPRKDSARLKGLVNPISVGHAAESTSVNLAGDNRRDMTGGKDILKKLRNACAEVLDEAGVGVAKKKHVLHSVLAVAEENLSPRNDPPGRRPAPEDSALLSEPSFPKGPPGGQLWTKHRKIRETPASFILRIYGSRGAGWLDQGLTLKQLRERDPLLVAELYRWRRTHKLPKALQGKLPTMKQRNDRMLNSYAQAHRPRRGNSLYKELGRLRSACQRRPEFS